jgi:hypothetical protein
MALVTLSTYYTSEIGTNKKIFPYFHKAIDGRRKVPKRGGRVQVFGGNPAVAVAYGHRKRNAQQVSLKSGCLLTIIHNRNTTDIRLKQARVSQKIYAEHFLCL